MSYIDKSQDVRDFLDEVKDELKEAIKMLNNTNEDNALEVCDSVKDLLFDLQLQI